jgi:transposase
VIAVLDGRDRRTIERWLSARSPEIRAGIEVVSIDPYDAYRQAIRAALPHARIVCDHFHLVRGANAALRRGPPRAPAPGQGQAPQGGAPQRPARRGAPRALPLPPPTAQGARTPQRTRAPQAHRAFERDPLIAEAWGLKETFRDVYRATDRAEAQRRLELFLAAVDRAGLPAFDAFAKGIRIWQEELLAYCDEPTTNGYAEGIINKVKVIKRRAYGIPTFTAFRQRVLLACS